jgi:O-acetyl-ADP-ribose deacetylase (regulator of RNase III)
MKVLIFKNTEITIKKGNLVDEMTDAIVCPANSFNHMRGGLAATIRLVGGDSIETEAMSKSPVQVGNAIITSGGKLKARFVIHAPTMTLPVEPSSCEAIRKAVRAALVCATINDLKSIAFPGMGTGTGFVPYDEAALAMMDEIKKHLSRQDGSLKEVALVAYCDDFYEALVDASAKVFA